MHVGAAIHVASCFLVTAPFLGTQGGLKKKVTCLEVELLANGDGVNELPLRNTSMKRMFVG